MHLASGLPLEIARKAAGILFASLWQGPLLSGAVWLCLGLVPKARPALRHLLWTAVLLALTFLPLLESLSTQRASSSHGALFHLDLHWSLAVAALWAASSLIRAGDLAHNAIRLRRLLARAVPMTSSPGLAALLRLSTRPAELRTSLELDRPGVLGFFSPCILIPAWLPEQLSAPELEQIVLHELEHLRRRDDWLNLIQQLTLVLFPLNPILLWINRRLCLERELACDEGVIHRAGSPRLYATCLARLAEQSLNHRSLSLALGFLERQSQLARRVAGVLGVPRALSPRQNLALTGGVALLLLGGSVELARCPQLVSFAAKPVLRADTQLEAPPGVRTWVSQPSSTPIIYTDAAAGHMFRASLPQPRKAVRRKVRVRHSHAFTASQRTVAEPVGLSTMNATATAANVTLPVTVPPTPTLVRYTLVHVDGGWLFLQL